jgi:hypothetical protein
MTENIINTQTPKGFNAYLNTGGTKFWLSAILISLLVPPAGVLLAVYLIFRRLRGVGTYASLAAASFLIAAALAGSYGYFKAYQQLYNNRLKHSYSQLENYSMPGSEGQDHSGMSFLKPKEFIKQSDTKKPQFSRSILVHYQDASKKENAAVITATSSAGTATTRDPAYIDAINSMFQKHEGSAYQSYRGFLEKYLEMTESKNFKVSITNVKPLHNKNVDKNAWEFDYVTKSKSNSLGYKQGQIIRQGKLVFAFGNLAYYYFQIDTNEKNYLANQQIWRQIIDSLKFDQ